MNHSFRIFKELVSCLSQKELLQLKKKLDANSEAPDKNKTKSKDLLKWVLKKPEILYVELEKKLYDISHKEAFDKFFPSSMVH